MFPTKRAKHANIRWCRWPLLNIEIYVSVVVVLYGNKRDSRIIVLHNMICERYVNDVMGDTQQMIKMCGWVSIESYYYVSVYSMCSCTFLLSPTHSPFQHFLHHTHTSTINENDDDGYDYETLSFRKFSRSVAFNEETRFQHVRVNYKINFIKVVLKLQLFF